MRSPSPQSWHSPLSASPASSASPLSLTPPSTGLTTPATELLTPPLSSADVKLAFGPSDAPFAAQKLDQPSFATATFIQPQTSARMQLQLAQLLHTARHRTTPERESYILASFDRWAREGQLEAGLSALGSRESLPPLITELLPFARVQSVRPLLVGHRGLATEAVENTIEGARACLDAGADGVEIDLALVRGDRGGFEAILRHDTAPPGWSLDGLFTAIRNVGYESFVYSQMPLVSYPRVPSLLQSDMRKPSHHLKLGDYREHYGYVARPGLDTHIPTFSEFTHFLAHEDFRDRLVFLDVKVPGDDPNLINAMAMCIARAVGESGLDEKRFVVASFELPVLAQLRAQLGEGYLYSLGSCLVGPRAKPSDARVLDDARASGAMAHVGHWFFGSDRTLIDVVKRDGAAMRAEGHKLGVWTVNDALTFRKLLGAGTLGLVISDDTRVLARAWQRIAG